ncbi:hypothetical protein EKO04_008156 [Ascochyta lentis]|uniref:BTB domain-containing protein n=1 Tax=Ascochyta lentis TaxID=205686 RepID=A0A8H7IVZ4_9PLEO|nr:hypothetical protein EKO04_008156 [Ascochyta lentis]
MSRLSTVTTEGGFVVVEIANGVKHHLHRALLIQHSEYFKKALNGPWKESHEGVVRLDDVKSGPFNIFVDRLYSGKVPLEDDYHQNCKGEDTRDIIKLGAIALGNRSMAPAFAKATQKHFIDKHLAKWASRERHCKSPSFEVIICAFSILRNDNDILKMLVDQHVSYYTVSPASDALVEGRKVKDRLPHELLVRVIHKYGQTKTRNGYLLRACDYHGHASQDERALCAGA